MYTSDIKQRAKKTALLYFCVSVFCAVFGAVYETFGHGVFSFFMAFCFLPPLLLGCAPFFAVYLSGIGMPGRLAYNIYNSGIATITVGFVFRGVIEIYGTTNKLAHIYSGVGALFMLSGAIIWLVDVIRHKKTIENNKNM